MNAQRAIEVPRHSGQLPYTVRKLLERFAPELRRHARLEFRPHFVMDVIAKPHSGFGKRLHGCGIRLALLESQVRWNELGRTAAQPEPMHIEEQLFGRRQRVRFVNRRLKIEWRLRYFLANKIKK